jgi:hypothetical protein
MQEEAILIENNFQHFFTTEEQKSKFNQFWISIRETYDDVRLIFI